MNIAAENVTCCGRLKNRFHRKGIPSPESMIARWWCNDSTNYSSRWDCFKNIASYKLNEGHDNKINVGRKQYEEMTTNKAKKIHHFIY